MVKDWIWEIGNGNVNNWMVHLCVLSGGRNRGRGLRCQINRSRMGRLVLIVLILNGLRSRWGGRQMEADFLLVQRQCLSWQYSYTSRESFFKTYFPLAVGSNFVGVKKYFTWVSAKVYALAYSSCSWENVSSKKTPNNQRCVDVY